MAICLECGAERPKRMSMGGLTVQLDPPRMFWKGMPLPGARGAYARILLALMRTGKASHFAMQMTLVKEDAGAKVISTHITLLRRLLPPEVAITAIPGWGYELTISKEKTTMSNLEDNTTVAQEPVQEAPQPAPTKTLKELTVSLAGNIGKTDQMAVLVVIQADGQTRVSGVNSTVGQTLQALGSAVSVAGKVVHGAGKQLSS